MNLVHEGDPRVVYLFQGGVGVGIHCLCIGERLVKTCLYAGDGVFILIGCFCLNSVVDDIFQKLVGADHLVARQTGSAHHVKRVGREFAFGEGSGHEDALVAARNKRLQLFEHTVCVTKGFLGNCFAEFGRLLFSELGVIVVDLVHLLADRILLLNQFFLISGPELAHVDAIAVAVVVAGVGELTERPVKGILHIGERLTVIQVVGLGNQACKGRDVEGELGAGHGEPLHAELAGDVGAHLKDVALRLVVVSNGVNAGILARVIG